MESFKKKLAVSVVIDCSLSKLGQSLRDLRFGVPYEPRRKKSLS